MIKRAFDKLALSEKDLENENRYNLTIMQGHIMELIYRQENHQIQQCEIKKTFKRRRSTITGILKLMEKNGLITREYSKQDARVKMINLTDKAISLHQEAIKNMEMFNRNLEKGLTQDEINTFYSIMDKIKKNLE